jgi:hypothetical protein
VIEQATTSAAGFTTHRSSYGLTRFIASFLFGVKALDPLRAFATARCREIDWPDMTLGPGALAESTVPRTSN